MDLLVSTHIRSLSHIQTKNYLFILKKNIFVPLQEKIFSFLDAKAKGQDQTCQNHTVDQNL